MENILWLSRAESYSLTYYSSWPKYSQTGTTNNIFILLLWRLISISLVEDMIKIIGLISLYFICPSYLPSTPFLLPFPLLLPLHLLPLHLLLSPLHFRTCSELLAAPALLEIAASISPEVNASNNTAHKAAQVCYCYCRTNCH